jgi:hypothetical protein
MKGFFAVLCAVLMVVAVSNVAKAGPMDSLNWQVYDSFPGPGLNPGLWQSYEGGDVNTTITVNNGLTISPTTTGILRFGIYFNTNSAIGFAMKIPFQISNASGSFVYLGLDVEENHFDNNIDTKDIHIGWLTGDGSQGISGPTFHSGHHEIGNMVSTDVSQGWLGYIYNGTTFSGYYNDGTGWEMLWSGTPGWTGQLDCDIDSNGSLTATVNKVFIASLAPVPVPPSLFLLAPGLLGLAAIRRRFRK